MLVLVDGRKIDGNSTRTCADPYLCVNGSMNSGQSKVTFNSQCCNTEFCNTLNVPGNLCMRSFFPFKLFYYSILNMNMNLIIYLCNLYRLATTASQR